MIQSFLCTYKSIELILNFYFWKKYFFQISRTIQVHKQTTYLTITFDSYFQMSLKFRHMEDTPRPHFLLKFQPQIIKSPLTCIIPCCQKMQSGPSGINSDFEVKILYQTTFILLYNWYCNSCSYWCVNKCAF